MESRNLETLLCVLRLGGVSVAARHLNLTQPTVTRRIQELERALDAKLFQRSGRQITPTSAARRLVVHAERALLEVNAMRVAASSRAATRGTVRAGVAELVALTWFDRLLVRINKAYPDVTIDMEVDLSSNLVDRLARRQVDVVFLPGPIPVAGVIQTDVGTCTIRWVARRSVLGDRESLTPANVAALPIIMSPQGSDVHGLVSRWFAAAGVQPKRLSTCNNLGVKVALVRNGRGISPLPTEIVAGLLASGELVALPEQPTLATVAYSAAYMPSYEIEILPEIATFAQEESWFAPG